MNEAHANISGGIKQASEVKGVVQNISNHIYNINVKMAKMVVNLKNSFLTSQKMYTILRIARVFYEICQVKRNHSVSSAESLIGH